MSFRASGPETESQAHEVALQLDEIADKNDLMLLEQAIRYMSSNTRETLKRAMEIAERNN